MRIAVFIKSTTFHQGFGGLETQNKVLCEGLVKKGHEVVVFSPARELPKGEKELNGVLYIFIPCVFRMLLSTVDRNNWYTRSYQHFISSHRKTPFDAVISQSSAGLGVINRKGRHNVRMIGISHGTIGGEMRTLINSAKNVWELTSLSKSLIFGLTNYFGRQRQYIHGCDRIVAVSSAVKKAIINETFAAEEKITVIHNGVDGALIQPRNWKDVRKDEPFKVLYVGRIDESKGLDVLLNACQDLDGVFINIVGDGPYLEKLRAVSRTYKMSQKVLFYGKLPYEKVTEIYSCNNVFVLPTRRVEGLPMTLVESCFAGIPIIATDMGGNKDVVEEGVNGILLKSSGVKDLKEAIKKLQENPDMAERMGVDGRIKAEREFTIENMLINYEQLLCRS